MKVLLCEHSGSVKAPKLQLEENRQKRGVKAKGTGWGCRDLVAQR